MTDVALNPAEVDARLVVLCQEMADHTHRKCSGQGTNPCRVPHSCCEKSVCELTIDQAKWDWGVDLPRTNHPKYPLMAPEGGCTVPPHMRPLCTVHCCIIQSWGGDPTDPAWTKRYWELRTEIGTLLARKLGRSIL